MLSNQFNKVLKNFVSGNSFSLKCVDGTSKTLTISTPNNTVNYVNMMALYMAKIPALMDNVYTYSNAITATLDAPGVHFGTGTAIPTSDDYKLENRITMISSDYPVTKKVTQNGDTITGVYTITNNTSNDITITEIGLYGKALYSGTSSYLYLVDRTLLDSPVTIPANGGIGQVTYTITVS